MTKIKNSFGKKKSIGKIEKPSRLKVTYSDFLTYYQKEKSNQIRFLLTFPTFGFKEVKMRKLLQLGLLSFIVGDSPSSRLAKLLRENNNLVYSVGSDTVDFPFMGEFIIGGSVAKENLSLSMQLIKKELEKIKKNGVQKKETQKAKNLYRRNIVCFNFETPLQIADWVVGEELAGRKIRLPEEYMRMVEKISEEEIGYLAQEIFDFSKINIGFMGNLKKDEVEKATSVFK